jgi:hypothetical protein
MKNALKRNNETQMIDSYAENFSPYEYWKKNCYFFMFDLPRIERKLKRNYPQLVKPLMSFILNKQHDDEGRELSNWDKLLYLRSYKVKDKKIFKCATEFIIPKWHTLYNLMSDAFAQLSLYTQADKDITINLVQIEPLVYRTRYSREMIVKAIKKLKKKGEDITYKNVMKESGIKSRGFIAGNRNLLKGA